jgi:glutaredoxin
MVKKIILLTTKRCPYCPIAKDLWESLKKDYEFDFEEIDAFTPEGQAIVKQFNLSSVPTTILDENGKREVIFIGVPNKEEAIKILAGE